MASTSRCPSDSAGGDAPAPGLFERLADVDPIDLAGRLTLLDLALLPVGEPLLRVAVLGCAVLGLLLPRWLRRPELWLALTGLLALRVLLDWPLPDNHAYLLVYWCLALCLARVLPDGAVVLARNARWLIALCFLFATLWKLFTPEYLDGTFFEVTLLRDTRFEELSRLAGGISAEDLEWNRERLAEHVDGIPPGVAEAPELSARFLALARFATLWTLGFEALLALAFLWPLERGLSRLRNVLLLSFCATTYAVATVAGFGWLLVAMGLAQCGPGRPKTRLAYVAVFLLILAFDELAWLSWLAERAGA